MCLQAHEASYALQYQPKQHRDYLVDQGAEMPGEQVHAAGEQGEELEHGGGCHEGQRQVQGGVSVASL